MREVEYRPEFAPEAAAVMTTKFITAAAAPKPTSPNIVTNGDWPGSRLFHGVTHMMAVSAAT